MRPTGSAIADEASSISSVPTVRGERLDATHRDALAYFRFRQPGFNSKA